LIALLPRAWYILVTFANDFVGKGWTFMIEPRKTGAFISKLRRDKDWTQTGLADRLHVTHQAVSRWETGDSFPDVGVLAQMAQLFDVRVDDLLNGEKHGPMAAQTGRVSTGEVITELAQGHVDNVARMVKENQADLDSVIAAGPLTRPSLMREVVQKMEGMRFTREQVASLAPFLDEETLGEIVEGLDGEGVDEKLLGSLAPFLGEEFLDRMAERVLTGEVSAEKLIQLAPFLGEQTLDRLAQNILEGTLESHHLVALAPFLSESTLDDLVGRVLEGSLAWEQVKSLAPFLSENSLDRLVEAAVRGTASGEEGMETQRSLTSSDLIELAPFLSEETIKRLVHVYMESGTFDPEMIVSLAPFIDKATLTDIIRMGRK